MKRIITFVLCMLLGLSCMAMAEETAEYDALWARLSDYRDSLLDESAALQADIEALQADIDYINAVLQMAQMQLADVQADKADVDQGITLATQLLEQPRTADNVQRVLAVLPPENLKGKHYVQIEVAGYGTIIAELDADAAPLTVTNFMELVESGFYDGLTFHRIIKGFMIQGGDPKGNGTGGSGKNIKGEFSQNGWDNPITHERGVLSMARSSAPNSASSQFFIMHQAAPHLDGAYAAFGRVLSGIEVVDAICANTTVTDSNGTVAAANQPVITSIRVIDKPE